MDGSMDGWMDGMRGSIGFEIAGDDDDDDDDDDEADDKGLKTNRILWISSMQKYISSCAYNSSRNAPTKQTAMHSAFQNYS